MLSDDPISDYHDSTWTEVIKRKSSKRTQSTFSSSRSTSSIDSSEKKSQNSKNCNFPTAISRYNLRSKSATSSFQTPINYIQENLISNRSPASLPSSEDNLVRNCRHQKFSSTRLAPNSNGSPAAYPLRRKLNNKSFRNNRNCLISVHNSSQENKSSVNESSHPQPSASLTDIPPVTPARSYKPDRGYCPSDPSPDYSPLSPDIASPDIPLQDVHEVQPIPNDNVLQLPTVNSLQNIVAAEQFLNRSFSEIRQDQSPINDNESISPASSPIPDWFIPNLTQELSNTKLIDFTVDQFDLLASLAETTIPPYKAIISVQEVFISFQNCYKIKVMSSCIKSSCYSPLFYSRRHLMVLLMLSLGVNKCYPILLGMSLL